jgi:hypothetical protein
MRYLITGFNSETGEIYHGEEVDQAGAEHQAVTWLETKPLGSVADVTEECRACQPLSHIVSTAKRVSGGVEWL